MPSQNEERSVSTTSTLSDRRILVVEDMPPTQRLYATILRRAGAEVTLDCNGDSAVAAVSKAARRGEPFDAILIDLLLIRSDGLVTTRHLRAQDFGGVILGATAHWRSELAATWRSAGCDECLAKPLNIGSLPELIARLIARRTPPPSAAMMNFPDHAGPIGRST